MRVNQHMKREIMSKSLVEFEKEALEYLYGGGDETIECRSMVWVITRHSHKCVSVMHKGPMTQPKGARMVLERAKVDGRFGSCYTCEACIQAAARELTI
jgi:hypothetical protein